MEALKKERWLVQPFQQQTSLLSEWKPRSDCKSLVEHVIRYIFSGKVPFSQLYFSFSSFYSDDIVSGIFSFFHLSILMHVIRYFFSEEVPFSQDSIFLFHLSILMTLSAVVFLFFIFLF